MPSRRFNRDYTPHFRFGTPTSDFTVRLALNLRSGGKLALSRHDVAYTCLQRYFMVLGAALATLELTDDEARWLVGRLGDINYLPAERPFGHPITGLLENCLADRAFSPEEEDAETARIDLSSLLMRVRRGGLAAEAALADAAERYWMPEYEDMGPDLRLRVVGLLRAA